MVVSHNIPALKTHLSMRRSDRSLAAAMQRLSTGFRINSAKDDAAGLAIANKLSFQVNGLNRASDNATHGISLVQTAEGALNEMHNMLQRMRELAVQSANDTNVAEDRALLAREIEQLVSEIHLIANRTEFNRMRILNGEADRVTAVTKSPNPPAFIPNPPAGQPGHVIAEPPIYIIVPNPPAGTAGHDPGIPEFILVNNADLNPSDPSPPAWGPPYSDYHVAAGAPPFYITNPPDCEPGHVPGTPPPYIVTSWDEIPNPPVGAPWHDNTVAVGVMIPNPPFGDPGHRMSIVRPNPPEGSPGHDPGHPPIIPNPPPGEPGHVPGTAVPPTQVWIPNPSLPSARHNPGTPPVYIVIPNPPPFIGDPPVANPDHVLAAAPTTIVIPNPGVGEPGHDPGPPPPETIFNPPSGSPGHVPGTAAPATIPNPPPGQPGHVPGTAPPAMVANPPAGTDGHVPGIPPATIPNPPAGFPGNGHVPGTIPPMITITNPPPTDLVLGHLHVPGPAPPTITIPNPPVGQPGHVPAPPPPTQIGMANPLPTDVPLGVFHQPASPPLMIPNPPPGHPLHDPTLGNPPAFIPNPPAAGYPLNGHVPVPVFIVCWEEWTVPPQIPNPAPGEPGHVPSLGPGLPPFVGDLIPNPLPGEPGHVTIPIPTLIANPLPPDPRHVPMPTQIPNPPPGQPGHVPADNTWIPNPPPGDPGHVPAPAGPPDYIWVTNDHPNFALLLTFLHPPVMITINNPPLNHPTLGHLHVPGTPETTITIPNPAPGQPGHVPATPPAMVTNPAIGQPGHIPGTPPPTRPNFMPGHPLHVPGTPPPVTIPNPGLGLPGHVPAIPPPTHIPNPPPPNLLHAPGGPPPLTLTIPNPPPPHFSHYYIPSLVYPPPTIPNPPYGQPGHVPGAEAVPARGIATLLYMSEQVQPGSMPITVQSLGKPAILSIAGGLTWIAPEDGSFTLNGNVFNVKTGDNLLVKLNEAMEYAGMEMFHNSQTGQYHMVTKMAGRSQEINLSGSGPILAAMGIQTAVYSPGTDAVIAEPLQLLNINGIPIPGINMAAAVNGNQVTVRGTGGEDIRFNIQSRVNPDNPPQLIFGDVDGTPASGAVVPMDLDFTFREFGPLRLQIGPRHNNAIDIQIPRLNAETLGLVEYVAGERRSLLLYTTSEGSQAALSVVDRAINTVSAARSRLGAFQNRLEATVRSLDVAAENTESSRSRIKDTDMARDSINFAQYNVMFQAAQAMLGQANQRPQQLLSLLQ